MTTTMVARTLAEFARVTGGALHGADRAFAGVSTDTRTLAGDQLFVALRGPNFDGHAFAAQAAAAGAAGIVVERPTGGGLAEVRVADTRIALGRAAAAWRARFAIPVVGVTGSNGKTTTKQLLASILARRGATHATRGNLNNDIGVPLTLFQLDGTHAAAVIEMGANHAGEIAALAGLAAPTVGIVTNAGAAHLEGFGSLDGVARAKGELFAALPADGVAVVNADDRYAGLWRGLAGARRTYTFGRAAGADFGVAGEARPVGVGAQRFTLRAPAGERVIELPLPGRHNVVNALGAAAAAVAAGATLDHVAEGLAAAENVGGRLRLVAGRDGVDLVDDTYNANPGSMRAALEWAASLGRPVLFAMGDMGELGPDADRLHAEVGRLARELGVARLYATGARSRHAVAAFGAGASHHADAVELAAALAAALAARETPGALVLVKGSRSARMERVLAALTGNSGG